MAYDDETRIIADAVELALYSASDSNIPRELLLLIGEFASIAFAFDPENSSANGWKFLDDNTTVQTTCYKYNYLVANKGFQTGVHAWRVSFVTTTMYILFGVSSCNQYLENYTFRDKSVQLLYVREASALEWPANSSEMRRLSITGWARRDVPNVLDLLLDCDTGTLTYAAPHGRQYKCRLPTQAASCLKNGATATHTPNTRPTWYPHISIGAAGITCSIESKAVADFADFNTKNA